MQKQYGKTRLILTIYIAAAVSVLGVLILNSVGTNNEQNQKIAHNAQVLAKSNCGRANYTREKVNVVSGALVSLLRKSVKENPEPLTPDQQVYLQRLYRKLRPLNIVDCTNPPRKQPRQHEKRDS